MQYYGRFNRSVLYPVLQRINAYLVRFLRNKFRRVRSFKKAKAGWQRITGQYPRALRPLDLGQHLLVIRTTTAV
jgi:RNA-directed DNA polymerase